LSSEKTACFSDFFEMRRLAKKSVGHYIIPEENTKGVIV